MKYRTNKKASIKHIIFITLLLVFVIFFSFNLLSCNKDADYDKSTINKSFAEIATFDYSEVTSVESEIKRLEATEAKTTFDPSKPLTNAQYQQIFNGSIVVGDSITEGLVAYGYLTEETVFCQIGASLINGNDLFSSAASSYPLKAIFAFGMNDILNYNGDPVPFIERYEELLNEFHEISPKTKIYINSISVPGPEAIESKPDLANYSKFNSALKAMCKKHDYGFIDTTNILKEHSDLYAGDGIHVMSEYYPIWINTMIMKAGM